ncbi:hypothetical protein EDB92DRAFT_1949322 [Lactarius akahatsu]|uniref:Uncharacterized protein n=1 Tax=Lactarius akahatsu TaxID=416441 RepID=A0AAD4LA23_9AGAM|nr:hypothetical protein EDB92DRAFT_1949322 [Lactarius akahatsu]
MVWLIFFWPMSKVNVNALLAMLNSRDYISCEQSTAEKNHNAFDLSSIRIEQQSEAEESTCKPPAVSLSVHRSVTTDFPQPEGNFDRRSEYTVDLSKSV